MAMITHAENTYQTASNRKYYLVDFDSVRAEGLNGMEELSEEDNLIIFFSKSEDNVSFSVLSKLYSCKARITPKEIGEHSMIDAVIMVFIGSIIHEDAEIHLVSRNGDYIIKAIETAIGNDTKISVQQNISEIKHSDDEIRCVSDTQTTDAEIEKTKRGRRRPRRISVP